MLKQASTDPVTAKAVHDPHDPWFLTDVTTPWSTQEKESRGTFPDLFNDILCCSLNESVLAFSGTGGRPLDKNWGN